MRIAKSTPDWYAELDTDVCSPNTNANLTLTLKIAFNQINPKDGETYGEHPDGEYSWTTRWWTPESWQSFMHNLVRKAEHFWNGRFWLFTTLTC